MKLEASLKHFSPQGMHISDDVKGTSPDRLTGTDVMAAIGTTSSRARFGLAAFFGKAESAKRMNSSQFRRWRDMRWMSHRRMFAKQLVGSSDGACRCWHNLPLLITPVRRLPA
jgi:hypothetical protein